MSVIDLKEMRRKKKEKLQEIIQSSVRDIYLLSKTIEGCIDEIHILSVENDHEMTNGMHNCIGKCLMKNVYQNNIDRRYRTMDVSHKAIMLTTETLFRAVGNPGRFLDKSLHMKIIIDTDTTMSLGDIFLYVDKIHKTRKSMVESL